MKSNTTNGSQESSAENPLSQIDVLSILNRRKWSLVFAAICGLAVGGLYMLYWPTKYESTAQIMLMLNTSGAMATNTTGNGQKDVSEELLATHIQIIQSPRIVSRALGLDRAINNAANAPAFERVVAARNVESQQDIQQMPSTESTSELSADVEATDNAPESTKKPLSTEVNESIEAVANDQLLIVADLPSIQQYVNEKASPVDYVISNLYVTAGGAGKARKSHALTIKFVHSDPEDARKVVAVIIEQYEKFVKDKFQDVNSEAAKLIVNARSELEGELNDLADKYQKFRSSVPLLAATSTGGNIYQQRYEELAAQLSKLLLDYDETEGRLSTVQEALKNITGTSPAANLEKLALIDDANAQRLGILIGVERGEAATAAFMAKQPERAAGAATEYQSLLKMKSQLATMREDFGNNHPEVKALANEILATEKFLNDKQTDLQVTDEHAQLSPDDVMLGYIKMLENDLSATKKRQKDVANQMQVAETQAKELVTFELQNETMIRAREHREALYDSVLERLREINMQGASSAMINEVLNEPEFGEVVEPKRSIAAVLSILTAGLVGVGLIVLGEVRDASIHSPSELESILNSNVIAHVPTFSNSAELWSDIKKLKATKPKIDPMLIVYHFSKSNMSEVFRTTRTQLAFAVKGEHTSIAFTSANEGDGKSTIVANVAVSIAQSGRSVILIDCDLRRPNTFRIFGIHNDNHGLTDFIENDEPFNSLITPGPVDNLTLLASGHISDNPAETLTSPKFASMIEDLKKKYDYVILDCPPLLPVSDPSIIASLVDSVVFIAKINKVSRPQIMRCEKILQGVGKKVDAIIVNRADEDLGTYGYCGYYDYKANGYASKNTKSTPRRG